MLAERGYVGRGYLGLALQPLRRGQTGLIAVEVAEGGPAAAAGLLVGDIVTTWEGEEVGSMRALSRRLGPDAIGSAVRLGLVRAGQPLELDAHGRRAAAGSAPRQLRRQAAMWRQVSGERYRVALDLADADLVQALAEAIEAHPALVLAS